MGSVDLDFVAPFSAHFTQSKSCILEKVIILDVSEANRNTRCVGHSVGANIEYVGLESARCGTHNEVEAVFSVDGKTGEFGGGIGQRGGYSSQTLMIAVYVEGTEFGCGEIEFGPF